MYIYYGVLSLCAVMCGTQFFFSQMFQKSYGGGFRASLVLSAGTAFAGIVVLSIINGFQFGYTHFSFIMALIVAANRSLFSFFSLKSFGKINLSLYSVFSMLGGMTLPFIAGILFYNEPMTLGKGICFVIIAAALFLTVEKDNKKMGLGYCIGIFIFNGMSGVLSKIYQAAPFPKVSAAEYSILCAVVSFVSSLILLSFVKGKKKGLKWRDVLAMFGNGTLNRVANFLLLVSLAVLPASSQYTFITGGTMIVSTIISYITHQAPSKRELTSVILAFAGLLILVFVP